MSGITLHEKVATSLRGQGEGFLTLLLLALAVVIFIIALMPDHAVFKAVVAAWVLIP